MGVTYRRDRHSRQDGRDRRDRIRESTDGAAHRRHGILGREAWESPTDGNTGAASKAWESPTDVIGILGRMVGNRPTEVVSDVIDGNRTDSLEIHVGRLTIERCSAPETT